MGAPCGADVPPVEKDSVRTGCPFFRWQKPAQVDLYLVGVIRLRQVEPPGYAAYMGIDNEGRFSKHAPQHNIRRLSSDPRQGDQCFHAIRHLTLKLMNNRPGTSDNVLRLVFIKSGRPNDRLQVSEPGLRKIVRGRIALKEGGGHLINACVCALGGKDGCHQQLKRGLVMKCGLGPGNGLFEAFDDF